jgi:ParB family chromosome partitioning protein
MAAKKMSGLGRGLGALIPQKRTEPPPPEAGGERTAVQAEAPRAPARADGAVHVPLSAIVANPEQPRTVFRHAELEELMHSIREHGILQPLTVSPKDGGGYELIAGERRYRAAKMLGLSSVPVIVRAVDARDKLVLALIENIQREDLDPLEEARAYERLSAEFGLTQEEIAAQVGKARSTVANAMRLLELPQEVLDAIAAGAVTAGSARAMLALEGDDARLAFFRKLMAGKMSTREVEAGVRQAGGGRRKDAATLAAEERLRETLGTRVDITRRQGKGKIVVAFYSDEEFDALLRKIG